MILCFGIINAPVAQLDRVFGYEPKGRGFESLLACQKEKVARYCGFFFLYTSLFTFTFCIAEILKMTIRS